MYRLEFTLPGLPAMTNPKSRGSRHWRAAWEESRRWRSMTAQIARTRRPPRALSRAKLTLVRGSAVAPDSDGLVSGFKPIIDGLVDARVLVNDRYDNIGMPQYLWERAPQGKGYVRIVVEAISDQVAAVGTCP